MPEASNIKFLLQTKENNPPMMRDFAWATMGGIPIEDRKVKAIQSNPADPAATALYFEKLRIISLY